MPMPNDGEVKCLACGCKLNRRDRNCYACGSDKLSKPAAASVAAEDEPIGMMVEDGEVKDLSVPMAAGWKQAPISVDLFRKICYFPTFGGKSYMEDQDFATADLGRLTITAALAEIKTLKARLVKRRDNVMTYFARDAKLVDPLADKITGGSMAFVRQERQAIGDMEDRIVKLRSAIQRTNLHNTLSVCGIVHTIADWLNWRREISEVEGNFLKTMRTFVDKIRKDATAKGRTVAVGVDSKDPQDVIIHVDEMKLAKEAEDLEEILGELDGKLSHANATINLDAGDTPGR